MNVNDELNALPKSVKDGDMNAVILPIFFFNRKRVHSRCWSFRECANLSFPFSPLICSGLNLMPTNKQQLASCILTRICESRKPGIRTHVVDFLAVYSSCMCYRNGTDFRVLFTWRASHACSRISKNRGVFCDVVSVGTFSSSERRKRRCSTSVSWTMVTTRFSWWSTCVPWGTISTF